MKKALASALLAIAVSQGGSGLLNGQQDRPGDVDTVAGRLAVLAAEENRADRPEELRLLIEAARSDDLQAIAIRALGRLERRELVTDLLPLLRGPSPGARAAAATALAQALRGPARPGVPRGQQEQAVLEALLAAGADNFSGRDTHPLQAVCTSLGRLPYEKPEPLRSAEAFLRRVLGRGFGVGGSAPNTAAARALESLARLNRRLVPLEDETVRLLRAAAFSREQADPGGMLRLNAMAALVAAGGVDSATLERTSTDPEHEVRRLAIAAVSGSGAIVDDAERLHFIRLALSDASHMVRYQAVDAWVRRGVSAHGCQPLLDALNDTSMHVTIAAMDALGDHCREDDLITDRLTSESRTPPAMGSWHREAHAFVAMAKRAPDRVAIAMGSFASHDRWQVRMYAARAAEIVGDEATLGRLAYDQDDNVVEAALPALRRRLKAESDAAFIAALARTASKNHREARPYQVIRTAANELKGAQPTPQLVGALTGALLRITAERCETSRDVRLALLERLEALGTSDQASALAPLLRDIDPTVAEAAARAIGRWTGTVPKIEPQIRQPDVPAPSEILEDPTVRVTMESGARFDICFDTAAPLSKVRFLRLVRQRYFDGLTFHRVVPNFVVQGGSPGADEYCGHCPFMRDEVGLQHTRGTIGVSTRGRDTGDAQIFINLVDNPRLDHQYTVFARLCTPASMAVVDEILEADRMTQLQILPQNRR